MRIPCDDLMIKDIYRFKYDLNSNSVNRIYCSNFTLLLQFVKKTYKNIINYYIKATIFKRKQYSNKWERHIYNNSNIGGFRNITLSIVNDYVIIVPSSDQFDNEF